MKPSAAFPRLLADVGGSHARFASQFEPQGLLSPCRSYSCADFETLWDAICHHLWREGLAPPRSSAIGIATAITGDHVRMTNHHWAFSIRSLKEALGLQRLLVLNDFSALALALPGMDPGARRQVGGGTAVAGGPIALIGPCTGLGVSGLIPSSPNGGKSGSKNGSKNGSYVPISGEGGHSSLASLDPEEAAVLTVLQRQFGHVSAEIALSGPGLMNLYRALSEVRGQPVEAPQARAITHLGLAGRDPLAVATLNLFCSLLGQVAGNLALTLGARGGTYLAGGIVPALGTWFDGSPFRTSFEAKGRLRSYLQPLPTFVLRASDDAALLGACRALDAGMKH